MEPPRQRRMLSSWKEIAAFFERDVRTVQRWEKDEGVPVHRHRHAAGASVYAYEEELRAWWTGHSGRGQNAARHWRRWHVVALVALLVVGASSSTVLWRALRATGGEPGLLLDTPPARFAFAGGGGDDTVVSARVGDLDGDGADDLAVSTSSGAVYLILDRTGKSSGGMVSERADARIVDATEGTSLRVTSVGDYNGDGLEDLLIARDLGSPGRYMAPGCVYLVSGRPEWPPHLELTGAADTSICAETYLSSCSRAAADIDGDGYDDMLLAEPEARNGDRYSSGAVYLLRGRARWPRSLGVRSAADVTVAGSRLGGGLGANCAVGDLDNDGMPEWAIYANESYLWNHLGGRGTVYVLRGRRSWPERLEVEQAAFLVLRGAVDDASYQVRIADIDGDDLGDLVLARIAAGRPRALGAGGGSNRSRAVLAWLGRGEPRGQQSMEEADVTIRMSALDDRAIDDLSIADLDGDGADDLVLAQSGRQVVFIYGRARWRARGGLAAYTPRLLLGGESGEYKMSISIGDLDGDTVLEVICSGPLNNSGGVQPGRVWVIRPHHRLTLEFRPGATPNVVVPGGVSAAHLFGVPGFEIDGDSLHVAGAPLLGRTWGDYNRDGISDLQLLIENRLLQLPAGPATLVVTGRTRDGALIVASDQVEVLPESPDIESTAPM